MCLASPLTRWVPATPTGFLFISRPGLLPAQASAQNILSHTHMHALRPTLVRSLSAQTLPPRRALPWLCWLESHPPFLQRRALLCFPSRPHHWLHASVYYLSPSFPIRMWVPRGLGLSFWLFLYPQNTAHSRNSVSTELMNFLNPHLIPPSFLLIWSLLFLEVPPFWSHGEENKT